MSADEPIVDLLDESKDKRVFSETLSSNKFKIFSFYARNILWRFTFNGSTKLTLNCDCGMAGSYWSVEAEHTIRITSSENEVLLNRPFVNTFFESKDVDIQLENTGKIAKIEIAAKVKEPKKLCRFSRFDFKNLSHEESSSVVFVIDGKKLKISKQFLATQTPVFASMFTSNVKERDGREIKIEGCSFTGFIEFMRILHFRASSVNNAHAVYEVLRIADRYQAQVVTDFCEHWLIKMLFSHKTSFRAIQALKTADEYHLGAFQHVLCETLSMEEIKLLPLDPEFRSLAKTTQLTIFRKGLSQC